MKKHLYDYDVFLSHNSQDKQAVEELARRLIEEEGMRPWLDKWNLVPGEPWQEALEQALDECATCAVFIGPAGLGPWQNEEMRAALDIRVKDHAYRVIPVLLPGATMPERGSLPLFLTRVTWVDFRKGLDDAPAFYNLVCGIKGVAPGAPVAEFSEEVCPYRGLQVFEEEHAPFFFGREALIQWLVEALRPSPAPSQERRFLAVIGPSGSGKSSVVRAGLVPQLRQGALSGSEAWPIIIFKPGPRPLEELAFCLFPLARWESSPDSLIDDLKDRERTLHQVVGLSLAETSESCCLALVVDQFEEVFTLCREESARHAFIANLLYAGTISRGRTVVILTLRADFIPRCATYPELAATLSDYQVLVSPMDEEELRRAIEKPAEIVGLNFEKGLVNRILGDVGGKAGALPLMEHALLELWERRRGRWLTMDAYDEIGGVQGALARRADAVYTFFSPQQQAIARRVLLRLTQPGENTEDTRRRAPLSELIPGPEQAALVEETIRTMVDARLLIASREEATGREMIDVSHEALIRGWPRLRAWLDEDRTALIMHRRLTEAAQEWERQSRDESYLWRGKRLEEIEKWLVTYADSLNPLEREFVQASQDKRKAERQARLQQSILRAAVIGLSLIIAFALVAVAWMAFTGTGPFETPGKWVRAAEHKGRVNVIAVDPTRPEIIYIGTEDKRVLKSSDRSQTWETVLESEKGITSLTVHPTLSGTVYAGTEEGYILQSTDGGASWLDLGRVLDAEDVTYLLVDPLKPDILYVCDSGLTYIYKSSDGGTSWITLTVGAGEYTISSMALAPKEDEPIFYLGTQEGLVFRSTDRGASWQRGPEDNPLPWIVDIAVSTANPDKLYVGTINGLYRLWAKEEGFQAEVMVEDMQTMALAVDPEAPDIVFASVLNGNIYMAQKQEDVFRNTIIATGQDFPQSSFTAHLMAGDHNPYFLYAATDVGFYSWLPSRHQLTWFKQ